MPTTSEGWRVIDAPATKSAAHINKRDRVLAAPIDPTAAALAIRGHLMAAVAFSPVDNVNNIAQCFRVNAADLVAAEEWRLLTIAAAAHFPMLEYIDHQEAGRAIQAATTKDYAAALRGIVESMGTVAEGKVKAALNKYGPEEWKKPLAQFRRQARKVHRHYETYRMMTDLRARECEGATGTHCTIPNGYNFTVRIARLMGNHAQEMTARGLAAKAQEEETKAANRHEQASQALRRFTTHTEYTGKGSTYDDVKLMNTDLVQNHLGKLAKRKIAANKGHAPRRVSRLYTDPQKRVFDRKIRTRGGVVLLDQSGSMSLEAEQVDAMIAAAGGAVVIGYSDNGEGFANTWIHAKEGRRSQTAPMGGNGNAVDASALRYAIAQRQRNHEPIVWVTDGWAYDKQGDMGDKQLTEIRGLVLRHGVTMVETAGEAISLLQAASRGAKPRTKFLPWLERRYQESQED